MAEFINHNSFLLFLLFIWLGSGYALIRKGAQPAKSNKFIILTLILLALYATFRPNPPTSAEAAEIQNRIAAGTPVLLEFQSPNWLACVLIEPVVNRLETDYLNKLIVLRVNIQSPAGAELSAIYGSRATPTFIFLDADGLEQWRMVGTLDEEKVIASIKQK